MQHIQLNYRRRRGRQQQQQQRFIGSLPALPSYSSPAHIFVIASLTDVTSRRHVERKSSPDFMWRIDFCRCSRQY